MLIEYFGLNRGLEPKIIVWQISAVLLMKFYLFYLCSKKEIAMEHTFR